MGHALEMGLGRLAWILIFVVPGPRWAKLCVLAAGVLAVSLARTRRR